MSTEQTGLMPTGSVNTHPGDQKETRFLNYTYKLIKPRVAGFPAHTSLLSISPPKVQQRLSQRTISNLFSGQQNTQRLESRQVASIDLETAGLLLWGTHSRKEHREPCLLCP